ncbi:MAG: hypothetical protein CM15mV41_0020 [Caudoviricetes sp.]|nr:MAG: hypothetical protein CM15mV41_0020 [Caudoviricetes sp.]
MEGKGQKILSLIAKMKVNIWLSHKISSKNGQKGRPEMEEIAKEEKKGM